MKKRTIGYVIDKMEVGEVAIKVEGNFTGEHPISGYTYVKGVHFDESDNGILKTLDGIKITIANNKNFVEEYYIILSREDYEKVLDTKPSLVATAY